MKGWNFSTFALDITYSEYFPEQTTSLSITVNTLSINVCRTLIEVRRPVPLVIE